MARALVLDASAALGILLGEPAAEEARATLASPSPRHPMVPAHFWLEISNVLVRRYGLTAADVVEILRDLDDLGLETVDPDRPSLLLALDLMAHHALSAYDAAYLALAEAADADLLTLDRRLAIAAGPRSAIRPRPTAHEDRAPYGSPEVAGVPTAATGGSALPDWTRHGRYLADLRRAAAAP